MTDYASQHSELKTNFSVFFFLVPCNDAGRFKAVLLHALAFLDSYKSHHPVAEFSFHSVGFVFVTPALASPCGEYIQKTDKLKSNCQKPS